MLTATAACVSQKQKTRTIVKGGVQGAVDSKKGLPACNAKMENLIYYVKDEKQLYVCLDGSWDKLEGSGDANPETLDAVWREIWKKNIESIARVEIVYESQLGCLQSRGTGFIVAQDTLVTNGHVAEDNLEIGSRYFYDEDLFVDCGDLKTFKPSAKAQGFKGSKLTMRAGKIRIWFPKAPSNDTEYFGRDPDAIATKVDRAAEKERDLALISAPTGERKPIKLSERMPAKDGVTAPGILLNEGILLMGFSEASSFAQFAQGKINFFQKANPLEDSSFAEDGAFFRIKEGTQLIGYDSPSLGGSSGSPVLDGRGEAIGVNFGSSGETFHYATHASHLQEFMASERQWVGLPDPANKNGFDLDLGVTKPIVEPAAGTYNHGLILKFASSDADENYPDIEYRLDGTTTWASIESCTELTDNAYCIYLNASQTVHYRMASTTQEYSASYVIENFAQLPATVSGVSLTEVETSCSVYRSPSFGDELNVIIKLANDTKLGSTNHALIMLRMDNLESRLPQTPDDFYSGFTILLKTDALPNYPGYNSDGGGDSCAVTITELKEGERVRGTATCNIAASGIDADFGTRVTFTNVVWQCDKWFEDL